MALLEDMNFGGMADLVFVGNISNKLLQLHIFAFHTNYTQSSGLLFPVCQSFESHDETSFSYNTCFISHWRNNDWKSSFFLPPVEKQPPNYPLLFLLWSQNISLSAK